MSNPIKAVNELIEEYELDKEKIINLDNLIEKMNIKLVTKDLDDGILGASKVKGLRKLIVLSSKIYNDEQRRFTLAHELGHILIHRGTHYYTEKDFNVVCSKRQKEKEADMFAVELLLPYKVIQDIIEKNDINLSLIKKIATEYKMSLTSTAIRLLELTKENIILIYHKNNIIKWWHKSNGEVFFQENYKGIDLERIEQKKDFLLRKVDLDLWISNKKDIYTCYEETIYFKQLNEYMTIIQII